MRTRPTSQRGLTLLELLVAISIFAILSGIGYTGLQMVLGAKADTDARAARLAELQFAVLLIQRDLEQAIARPVRDELGDGIAAMRSIPNEPLLLEFTRSGHLNPLNEARSELQRVAYRLRNRKLYRVQWSVLDRSPDSAPLETLILDDVEALELRFMSAEGDWSAYWPPANVFDPNTTLPRGAEVNLRLSDYGRVRRVVSVPGG